MDYERIEKSQPGGGGGGGFSPGKLRSMLLGAERKKKQEELESAPTLRSKPTQIDDPVAIGSDDYKDVDVVSELVHCSTSPQMAAVDYRQKDQSGFENHQAMDYDNSHESMNVPTSVFEFQKTEKTHQRIPIGPFSKPAPSKWDDAHKWIANPTPNRSKTGSKKVPSFSYGSRQSSTKILEVSDQKMITFEEPDTKRMEVVVDPYVKPVLMIENTVEETAINLSRHDSSISIRSATAFIQPPSTARSVSMRDMGTEMTPITSQEPSRTGTPVRATMPIRTPISSSPERLTEKEIQMKTRREIMMLGTQLGKLNIAAWASKEEEDKDASTSLKTRVIEQASKNAFEARALAWEEAEKAKYIARFKREELKIEAWENHQKAKSEAEMRKIEVEVERIKGKAQDRMMKKLAAVIEKVAEKRAAAEAKRNSEAAKTEKESDQIRRTGKMPSSFTCFGLCS